jgi:hypothetical protein
MNTQDEINAHCIRTEPYKGYKSTWCGDGAIIFRGPNGDEISGHSGLRTGWLEPAWLSAKAKIDAAQSANT